MQAVVGRTVSPSSPSTSAAVVGRAEYNIYATHTTPGAAGGGEGNPAIAGLAALPLSPLHLPFGQRRPSLHPLPHPSAAVSSSGPGPIMMGTPTAQPSSSPILLHQQSHQQQQSRGSSSSLMGQDEDRLRYHQYEHENKWNQVEKLSGYISRFAMAEAASSVDMPRERYHDLYSVAVHLLRAIEALDPALARPLPRYQTSQQASSVPHSPSSSSPSSSSSSSAVPFVVQGKSEYGGPARSVASHGSPMQVSTYHQTAMSPYLRVGMTAPFPLQSSQGPQGPIDSRTTAATAPRGLNIYADAIDTIDGMRGPVVGPMGIARYNQSILSGMLSMGGSSPSGPGQPIKPAPAYAAADAPQDSLTGGDTDAATSTSSSCAGKKKRRRKAQRRDLHCHVCGATDTPEWRRGPNGDHTLCNACGLHYAKALKKEKEAREKEGRKHSIDMLLNSQLGRSSDGADKSKGTTSNHNTGKDAQGDYG